MLQNVFSYKKMIPFIVSLAIFMEAVDTTIINTAIPVMANSLSVNPVNLKIALISYLLSLAIFIPISGWVADKFGIKKVFITAVTVFTACSLLCGFSHNLGQLVLARIGQGLGGSFSLPVGRLILVRTFDRHELIDTMSRVIMVAALGLMLGPVLGGFITHYFSWHWIFWVNIPVGIFTILLALSWIKKSSPQKVPPLDKVGFVLFGTGLASLTFGLSAFSETTVPLYDATAILVTSIILLSLYLLHSRKAKYPIVKKELFRSRTFRISVLGNLFSRLGFGGVPFLIPLYLQIGLGYSTQVSGLLLAPTAMGVLLVKPFSLRVIRALGFKNLLITNTVLVGMSLWTFMFINAGTSVYLIAMLTFFYGFLISLQYSGMNSLAYADLEPQNLSAATSIMSTMQQLAQSMGVAVGALLLRIFTPNNVQDFLLSTRVFHLTFLAMGFMTFFSIIIFVNLTQHDGDQMIRTPENLKMVT